MIPNLSLLNYPFESADSPFAEEVEEKVLQAIKELDLPHELAAKYRKSAFGNLATRFFPFGSRDLLNTAARHMLVFFAFDDLFANHSIQALQNYCNHAIAALHGHLQPGENHKLLKEFALLRNDLLKLTNQSWLNRYILNVRRYFDTLLVESYITSTKQVPGSSFYSALRENLVGLHQLVDFIEPEMEVILPDDVITHPYVQSIRQKAVLIMSWCNDYYSAPKEIQDGEIMNLVIVYEHEYRRTQQAYSDVVMLHNMEISRFLTLCENPHDFGTEINSVLKKYIKYLQFMITGHRDWTGLTFRYSSAF